MVAAPRVAHQTALEVAQTLLAWMQPHCERIEIGGSIRRGKDHVKDIELVLIPKLSWFEFTDRLLADGVFAERHGWGPKARYATHAESGVKVDMFTADETNYGYQLHLRTGPKEMNTRMMDWLGKVKADLRFQGGYAWYSKHWKPNPKLADNPKVSPKWVSDDKIKLATPEESDLFKLLGIPFIPPQARTVEIYRGHLNSPHRQWPDFEPFHMKEPVQPDLFRSGKGQAQGAIDDELLTASQFRFRGLQKLGRLVSNRYQAQEPPGLLTYPEIVTKYEDLSIRSPALRRWVLRLPFLASSGSPGFRELAWTWARWVRHWPDFEPDDEDFKALFWMQWSCAGAKTYQEIEADNRYLVVRFMQVWERRYGHLAHLLGWHRKFWEPTKQGEIMLKIDTDNQLKLTSQDFADGHVGVVGSTGSGKSNTTAHLVELLLGSIPFAIVDIEGEYRGLRSKFDNVLIVGESDHCDINVPYSQVEALARYSYEQGVSVILDFSHYRQLDNDPLYEWLDVFMKTLWELAFDARKSYKIVIEEAGEWIPQIGGSPVTKIMARIGSRGRKRGLTFLFTAQRFQQVNKAVVDHTELLFVHRTSKYNSLEACVDNMPTLGETKTSMRDMIRGLDDGQVVVVRRDTRQIVQMRLRDTPHGGSTPQVGDDTPDEITLLPLNKAIAESASKLAEKYRAVDKAPSPSAQQAVRVGELEAENANLRKQLESAKKQKSSGGRVAILEHQAQTAVRERDDLQKRFDTLKLKNTTVEAERDRARGEVNGQIETFRDVRRLLQAIMDKFADNESLVENLDDVVIKADIASAKKAYPAASAAVTATQAEALPLAGELLVAAQNRQQNTFEKMLRSVQGLSRPKAARAILMYMIENEGQELAQVDVGKALHYSGASLQPLNDLAKIGLLAKRFVSRRPRYQSQVRQMLRKDFCYLDEGTLIKALLV